VSAVGAVKVEDASSINFPLLISQAQTATLETLGYLGHRTVILLRDLSKIAKSPDALKYAFEGAFEVINALQLYIAVTVSDRAIEWATHIQMVVSAWSVGKSVQYFVTGAFLDDCGVTKVCTAVTEIFFCMARTLMVGSWLVDLEVLSLELCAATVGTIPFFGEALVAMGASPLIDVCFLIGILLLLVDRVRAVYGDGYVNQADEEFQAVQILQEIQDLPRDAVEGPLTRGDTDLLSQKLNQYVEEKKVIQLWVAWADVVNLLSEAALLILDFTPLNYYLLGLVASISGIISCVWDTNPDLICNFNSL